MSRRVVCPFPSLSSDTLISLGAAGYVHHISPRIVLKTPKVYQPPDEDMAESFDKINREKAVHRLLMDQPHPNIVPAVLFAPEGIFMLRMECTLRQHLEAGPVPPHAQERWVRQLTGAVAWLEHLGFVHGDLRPANVLLDAAGDLQLADFDAVGRPGEALAVAGAPFCKTGAGGARPLASPETNQFALASCVYTIRFGHEPWHDADPETMFRDLDTGCFPPVAADHLFGDVVARAWHGGYESVEEMDRDVLARLARDVGEEVARREAFAEDFKRRRLALAVECQEFMAREALAKRGDRWRKMLNVELTL